VSLTDKDVKVYLTEETLLARDPVEILREHISKLPAELWDVGYVNMAISVVLLPRAATGTRIATRSVDWLARHLAPEDERHSMFHTWRLRAAHTLGLRVGNAVRAGALPEQFPELRRNVKRPCVCVSLHQTYPKLFSHVTESTLEDAIMHLHDSHRNTSRLPHPRNLAGDWTREMIADWVDSILGDEK
jgi:hypothetical protein